MRRIAGLLWILSLQGLLMQFWVAKSFAPTFSLDFNTISDLGASSCGLVMRHGTTVCSPLHGLMNVSFIAFGLLWSTGSILLYRNRQFPFRSPSVAVPLGMAGFGAVLVGLYPEDSVGLFHSLGAGLEMVFGTIGFLTTGRLLIQNGYRIIGLLSMATGILPALAFSVFVHCLSRQTAVWGLGLGFWERVSFWPEHVWLAFAGVILLNAPAAATPA